MGTYLKKFQTESQYDEYISSSGFTVPNVSFIVNNSVRYWSIYNGYDYVDLGLPSGTLWAKCNVGAAKETDYGHYFQWGETEIIPNKLYNQASYKYYNNGFTKYNATDGLTSLELSDDAARVNMGGKWRMPTSYDFGSLLGYTTHTWAQNYRGSGINGILFSGRGNFSGSTLFLPAGGRMYYASNSNFYADSGTTSWYWCSNMGATYERGATYSFTNANTSNAFQNRYVGFPVRGVLIK